MADEAVAKPRTCATKLKGDDPTLVGFYPCMAAALLNLAKFYFQSHQIFETPFPVMQNSINSICQDVLDEAMRTFKAQGQMIEEGISFFAFRI